MVRKNLFLAYSSYHLLISISKARGNDVASDLVVFRYNEKCDRRIQKLKSWENNPFENIYIVEGAYERDNSMPVYRGLAKQDEDSLFVQSKRVIRSLKDDLEGDYSRIFSFNDTNPLTQYIFNRYKNPEKIAFEEGLGDYKEKPNNQFIDKLKESFARIYLGSWFRGVNCNGSYKETDKVKAFMPEKHCSGKAEKLDEDIFSNLSGLELPDVFNLREMEGDYCIILPPLSIDLDREELQKFVDKVEGISEDKIYVKYHPRESNKYLTEFEKLEELQSDLPAELIFLGSIRNEPDKVIGLRSTSLYSASIIFRKAEVVSLINCLGIRDSWTRVFENSRVKVI